VVVLRPTLVVSFFLKETQVLSVMELSALAIHTARDRITPR
jgi:hypothetical protein